MTSIFAKAGVAAIIALGTLSTSLPASYAGDMSGSLVQQVRYDRNRSSNVCSTRTAQQRARRMGMRSPRVVRVTSRTVVVEDRGRPGRWTIVFSNTRDCRLLRR